MVKRYRENFAAMIYRMAQEDPELILEFIEKLRTAGKIDADDLARTEKIAHKWIAIAQENRAKKQW